MIPIKMRMLSNLVAQLILTGQRRLVLQAGSPCSEVGDPKHVGEGPTPTLGKHVVGLRYLLEGRREPKCAIQHWNGILAKRN